MSTPEKPVTGAAVAARRPPHDYRLIERRKAAGLVAQMGWAEKISPEAAYAVVVWCETRDIDPVNELDVLGNKPVPNAKYWQRKMGELVHLNLLDWYEESYINADPRLDALALLDSDVGREALTESTRRMMERIKYNAPEAATAIAVVTVKLKALDRPVSGCQWAGGGTGRKIGYQGVIKTGSEADPIGELFDAESALTRAWGKVGRVVAAKVHALVTDIPDPSRLYAETNAVKVEVEAAQAKAAVTAEATKPRPVPQLRPSEEESMGGALGTVGKLRPTTAVERDVDLDLDKELAAEG